MPALYGTFSPQTTTVQDVINGTSQDIRKVLDPTQPAQASILIDYCDRISLQILRASNWQFLLSPPQQFVTQLNVTDYWIGNKGGNGLNQADTGLGLSDLRSIRMDSVMDRSNNVKLHQSTFKPLGALLSYPDASYRPGRPKMFRTDFEDRYVLSVYPAPDNQNNFQPVPAAPICTVSVNAGSQVARFYYVQTTFVDEFGNESTASNATRVYIPAGMVVTVAPPQEPITSATGIQYSSYNVYASENEGEEQLQNASPLSTNITWQEPASGLIAGVVPPSTNSLEPIDGYLIEFEYYKTRDPLTQVGQIIQVPDDYYDVVVAGVNYLANAYLKRPTDAKAWYDVYGMGLKEMVRDKWQFPKGSDYISPDPATINNDFSTVEQNDPSITRTN